jgi:hypothetical protein
VQKQTNELNLTLSIDPREGALGLMSVIDAQQKKYRKSGKFSLEFLEFRKCRLRMRGMLGCIVVDTAAATK